MPPKPEREAEKRLLRDLDGSLPERVDRRKFLHGTLAAMSAGFLAGCSGNSDGGDGGDGSDGGGSSSVTWRQPFTETVTWATAGAGQVQGYFDDYSNLTIEEGESSPDTVRRVGTGQAHVGHADTGSTISGLAEGMDATIVGVSRQQTILGLSWREDMMSGPQDLEGKSITLSTPFAEATWPVVPATLGLDESTIETIPADSGVSAGMISSGEVAAIWGGLNTQLIFHKQMDQGEIDTTVHTRPFNTFADVLGYTFFANDDWLADGNVETVTGLMEGFSETLKWAVTNPEEALDVMVEDVNPSLATLSERDLNDEMKLNVAICLSAYIQNGGGFLNWDEEWMQTTFDVFGGALVEDQSSVPSLDEVVDREPIEQADLATLSSDEFQTAAEWAQPIWDWF